MALLAMRIAAVVVATGVLLRVPTRRWWPRRENRAVGLLPGLFGVASLLVFVVAVRLSEVATVSILQALAPALTALLALGVLGQRMDAGQRAGLLLGVGAVALMAAS